MKRSRWFEGLLYAEEQYKEGWTFRAHHRNIFGDVWCIWTKTQDEKVRKSIPFLKQDSEFLKGVLDYNQHVGSEEVYEY